ncbi:hypothetical protein BH10PSE14_BH10PSE14_38990 [soil metagenome]
MTLTRNGIRNALSGFVSAYGVIAFICFVYVQQRWYAAAPHLPDVSHGLIVEHNQHGSVRYLSIFQATSCTLLLATGVPLFLVGVLIGPKKNMVTLRRRYSISARWDRDDPSGMWRVGTGCGVVAAPIIIFLIGPPLVTWLNAAGIALG